MAAGAPTPATPAGSWAALVGPGASFAGIDQGIDFTGGPANVDAPAAGTISRIDLASGWPGEHHLIVETLDKPVNGHRAIYFAEDIEPAGNLRRGSHVSAGQAIGTASGSGRAPGIEVGWALPSSGLPEAPLPPPRPASQWTQQGQDFHDWIQSGRTGTAAASGTVGGDVTALANAGGGFQGGLKAGLGFDPLGPIDTVDKALKAIFSKRGLEMGAGLLLVVLGVLWLARRGGLPLPGTLPGR